MRIIFMYHEDEPRRGSLLPGSLPNPMEAFKGARSLFLTQHLNHEAIRTDTKVKELQLRNQDVELPQGDDTLYWCKVFKLTDIDRKHHLIRVSEFFFFSFYLI